jgi:hypothetical protein
MGPCMCGDPYCGSCGNPGAAAWEDFSIEAQERFDACVAEAGSIEEGFYDFLEKNIHWLAESYNKSVGG